MSDSGDWDDLYILQLPPWAVERLTALHRDLERELGVVTEITVSQGYRRHIVGDAKKRSGYIVKMDSDAYRGLDGTYASMQDVENKIAWLCENEDNHPHSCVCKERVGWRYVDVQPSVGIVYEDVGGICILKPIGRVSFELA